MNKYLLTASLFLAANALFVPDVNAICEIGTSVGTCINQLGGEFQLPNRSADSVIKSVVKFILALAASLASLAIVIGGVMYILSFGDESKTARAKKVLLYAILGLLIAGLSGIIVLAVNQIF